MQLVSIKEVRDDVVAVLAVAVVSAVVAGLLCC